MPTPIIYTFDSTGLLPDNKIINESHNITDIGPTSAFLFVPDAAPFYGDSVSIVTSEGNTLRENEDYVLTHYWTQASSDIAIGLPIYGSVTMLNTNPIGVYRINYQTIGGEYVVNQANAIVDGLLATALEFSTIDWSTIPVSFPPTPHSLNTNAVNHYPLICETVMNLANAVKNKPDSVSADQIDGFVGLWCQSSLIPMLNLAQAQNRASNTFADAILQILTTQKRLVRPLNLQHYEIPFGNFIIRFGYHPFGVTGVPEEIVFGTNPFPNNCILAHVWLTNFNPIGIPLSDSILVNAPQVDKVKVQITLDPSTMERRRVCYIAIGQ